MAPFDRFTPEARHVLAFANEEAAALHHGYIGTEHLLLGLLRQSDGVAAQVLWGLGVELLPAWLVVQEIVGPGKQATLDHTGLTPGTKRVIEFTVAEAHRLGAVYIGTEHLLLGLLRERSGIAVDVLARFGVSLDEVRRHALRVLEQEEGHAVAEEEVSSTHARLTKGVPQWTQRVERVLARAAGDAARWDHPYLTTAHLLVVLSSEEEGSAAEVFARLGVSLDALRRAALIVVHGDEAPPLAGGPPALPDNP